MNWPSREKIPWRKRRQAYLDGKRRPRGATFTPESKARQLAIDRELQAEREREQKNGKPRMSLRMEDIYGSNRESW